VLFGYLFSYGVASMLCGVYPMEAVPRRSAPPASVQQLGQRIGAAFGTFLSRCC